MSGCIPGRPDINLEVTLQENGIFRLKDNGYLIGRLDDELEITEQGKIIVRKSGKVVYEGLGG